MARTSMNILFGLMLFVVIGVAYVFTTDRKIDSVGGSEQLTLVTGATKRVAGGSAQIWMGEIDETHSSENGFEPAAEFELTCAGQSFPGWAVMSAHSEEMRGFRIRLLEQLDTSPPSARIEVTWSFTLPTNQQAASSASIGGKVIVPPNQRSRAAPSP